MRAQEPWTVSGFPRGRGSTARLHLRSTKLAIGGRRSVEIFMCQKPLEYGLKSFFFYLNNDRIEVSSRTDERNQN